MQTIDSKVSNVSVVAFNPAINERKERVATQLIKELAIIQDMPDDMTKIHSYENWRDRSLALASELSDQQQSTIEAREHDMNKAKFSQVEVTKPNPLIETVDNLNRLTGQARAVITSLCTDDNFKTLNEATLANMLWLLGDRLDDIETQIKQIKLG